MNPIFRRKAKAANESKPHAHDNHRRGELRDQGASNGDSAIEHSEHLVSSGASSELNDDELMASQADSGDSETAGYARSASSSAYEHDNGAVQLNADSNSRQANRASRRVLRTKGRSQGCDSSSNSINSESAEFAAMPHADRSGIDDENGSKPSAASVDEVNAETPLPSGYLNTEARSSEQRKIYESRDPHNASAAQASPDPGEYNGTDRPLIEIAYERWHNELVNKAQRGDEERRVGRNVVVDLTHPHPTGAAQLFSHSKTRLSSLIREPFALERAQRRLMQLRELVAEYEAEYSYAPISLSMGRISWVNDNANPRVPHAGLSHAGMSHTGTSHVGSNVGGEQSASSSASAPDVLHAEGDTPATPSSKHLAQGYGAENTQEPGLGAGRSDAQNLGTRNQGMYDPHSQSSHIQRVNELAIFRRAIVDYLADGDAIITLTTHVELNQAVVRALIEHGAPAREIAELRSLISDAVPAEEVLRRLLAVAKIYLPEFSWEQESLLGCFIRPEHAILADFEAMKPFIVNSGVMLALAGDERRRELTSAPLPPPLGEDRSPEVERGAGDLDAIELGAVEAVAAGRSLLLDAVPGSKRFKVIASIVADAAASGKSVIFVPARAASTHALVRELDQLGLGELVLDMSEVSNVAMRIRTGLRVRKPEIDHDFVLATRDELVQTRELLEDFVNDLHREDPQWGVSVHDLLEHLARLTSVPDAPRTRVRLAEDAVRVLYAKDRSDVVAQLERGFDLGVFDRNLGTSAWNRSEIVGLEAGKRALEAAHSLNDTLVPELVTLVAKTAGETGLRSATTVAEWFEQLQVFKDISESLDTFLPKVFETSPMEMAAATATKEWREANGYSMKSRDRRDLRKQAEDLVRPGANPENLHQALMDVQERREVWRRYAEDGGWPILPSGITYARQNAQEVHDALKVLHESFPSMNFELLQLPQLSQFLAELVRDEAHLDTVPERNQVSQEFHVMGLDPFIADMRAHGTDREHLAAEYELALTSSIFEILITRSAVLAKLGPRDITHLLGQLRVLDEAHVESLAAPVAQAVVNNMRAVARQYRDDTLRLDAILQRIGDGDLRAVFERYSAIVQAARPVWIVPPVVAAEFIPQMPWVDVSVIETSDASSPAAVIAPMMRGRQTVLIGDTRRSRMIHDHIGSKVASVTGKACVQTQSAALAFSEILPVVTLPTVRALQDEATTRALMEHGYADTYRPIPSSRRVQTSHLIKVDGKGIPQSYGSGTVETTQVEVDAVVDAVVNHVLGNGSGSLAVVALTRTHAVHIRDALRKAARESIELANYIDGAGFEEFTVVDLTHAAGLRRDNIILAVGFGKTVHGRVLHSFGELAEPEGFVGLIDAIEAARRSITVISSFAPGDIDVKRVSTPGPKLLAQIIDYAAGVYEGVAHGSDREPAPLIADLAERIKEAGYETAIDFGYEGSTRIPLVVGSSHVPGTWAVAVLLDDAEYVAEPSLRQRDRHRVEAFENHGWKVVQTYSTSLFIDPVGQADAVIAAMEDVLDEITPPRAMSVPQLDDWGDQWIDENSPEVFAQSGDASVTRDSSVSSGDSVERTNILAHSDGARGVYDGAGSNDQAERSRRRERAMRRRRIAKRPQVTAGLPLSAYSDDELDDMTLWLLGNGKQYTEDELVQALRDEIALQRRGAQVDAVLRNVVRRVLRDADE